VNIGLEINIGEGFSRDVARILRETLGVEVAFGQHDTGHDIVVRNGDAAISMVVEFKSRVNAAAARQAVHATGLLGGTPLLVVAGETTADAREILRANDVAYVDGLGNADISLPGLVYRLVGRKPAPSNKPPTRMSGKAGRIAQTLLLHPDRRWHITELVEQTSVSQGFVHRVLARLSEEGILTSAGEGPTKTRSVVDPGALLDLWVEEQHDRVHRTLAYQLTQDPAQLRNDLVAALDRSRIDYAVTGASAASLVAPFVTAIPTTQVWVSASIDPKDLLAGTHAEKVKSGHNVAFLQAGDDDPLLDRQQIDGTWIVNDFRLYLDLRRDPRRGAEQAERLRQERIGF